jgi:hypothetical protein
MTKLVAHTTDFDDHERRDVADGNIKSIALIHPADAADVAKVLAADEDSEDGRSNWCWIRLLNGDLILGVFPQGDTYLDMEAAAQYPGTGKGA